MRLSFLFKDYYRDCFVRGLSSSTLEDYCVKIGKFITYTKDIDVSSLSLDICISYLGYLRDNLSSSVSVQSYVRSLKAFLSWLFNNKHIVVDISSTLKLPKARSDVISILTSTEITRLYKSLENNDKKLELRNKVLISLMVDCGLRLEEVVTLQKHNIYLDDRYIVVYGKGNKSRFVSFGNVTLSFLKQYLDFVSPFLPFSAFLFSFDNGVYKPITRDTIKNLFRKLKFKASIPRLYPHLLRHTFATRYLENGGDIYTLQSLLGHSSLDMVKKYLHLSSSRIVQNFVRFSPLDNC